MIAGEVIGGRGTEGSNIKSHMEIAKLLVFNEKAGRVGGFIIACKLYLKMKIRKAIVEKQVQ